MTREEARLIGLVGLLLTGATVIVALVAWNRQAALAAGVFGGVALAIQLAAFSLLGVARKGSLARFMARWGAGMGLRALGVGLFALAVALDGNTFPPLPSAIGFLGVLLPLLAMEVRLIR